MQKNYVLLRNDQQTGPYSLEEIAQFDLKPYDLIWIEGESKGWYYPQEIQALHPYLGFLPQKPKPVSQPSVVPEKKVHVAVPTAPKEEPLVTQHAYETLPYVPVETYKQSGPALKNFEEEIYAQFVKPEAGKASVAAPTVATQKKNANRSVGVAVATVLVVGGVFAASWLMNRHTDDDATTGTEVVASPTVQPESTDASVTNNAAQARQTASAKKQKKEKSIVAPKQKTTAIKQTSSPKEEQKNPTANSIGQNSGVDATVPVKEKQDPQIATTESSPTAPAETTAAPQEKKKKLRDKIFDIFRKKPEEQSPEEAKPAETENGERRSTRREDGASLAQLVSVRFTVPNDWMMGIKGAKATLVNRSSETVSKAVVEVLYYDDDNNLLQKKTITFGNVDSKDSKTVSIPDHSTATKVDYNVVSVTGKPGA